ncbi:MAG: hypothetical protein QOJ80_3256 [Mycobacterium sp.]|jgi:hypothetical protein|nr:hypothetical protein [Mycobacterium sp.]
MWGTLMLGALLTALNPVRLAVVALLISRPRPVQNLFAYWAGAVILGIPSMLIPLVVMHSTPAIQSFTQGLATNPTFRHVQIGLGVLALSIAALMIVRSPARQKAPVPQPVGNAPTVVLDPNPPNAVTRLLGRSEDAASERRSPIRRLLGRAAEAWEDGALWVACLLGMATGGPSLDGIVLGAALIVTGGASLGVQALAGVAFVFGMLLIVEIILVCSVAAPTRTKAILQVVHDWVETNRRKIIISLCALVGVALVAQGMGAM